MRLVGTEMLRECVLARVDGATYKLYGEVPFGGLKNLKFRTFLQWKFGFWCFGLARFKLFTTWDFGVQKLFL